MARWAASTFQFQLLEAGLLLAQSSQKPSILRDGIILGESWPELNRG